MQTQFAIRKALQFTAQGNTLYKHVISNMYKKLVASSYTSGWTHLNGVDQQLFM